MIESLSSLSACVVQVQAHEARALERAYKLAYRFFRLSPHADKVHCCCLRAAAPAGPTPVIEGYSQPSDAKELLRIFNKLPPGLPGPLRRAILHAQGILNNLLVRCMVSICRSAGLATSARSLRYLCRGACPLDIFFYHNRSCQATSFNCTPHVDRGFLHAIVVSPVDGLQLLDRRKQQAHVWRPPQLIWPHVKPHTHVVVLANDALARLSRSSRWLAAQHEQMKIDACVHRVVKSQNTARLSISYELRASALHDDVAELISQSG